MFSDLQIQRRTTGRPPPPDARYNPIRDSMDAHGSLKAMSAILKTALRREPTEILAFIDREYWSRTAGRDAKGGAMGGGMLGVELVDSRGDVEAAEDATLESEAGFSSTRLRKGKEQGMTRGMWLNPGTCRPQCVLQGTLHPTHTSDIVPLHAKEGHRPRKVPRTMSKWGGCSG